MSPQFVIRFNVFKLTSKVLILSDFDLFIPLLKKFLKYLVTLMGSGQQFFDSFIFIVFCFLKLFPFLLFSFEVGNFFFQFYNFTLKLGVLIHLRVFDFND